MNEFLRPDPEPEEVGEQEDTVDLPAVEEHRPGPQRPAMQADEQVYGWTGRAEKAPLPQAGNPSIRH